MTEPAFKCIRNHFSVVSVVPVATAVVKKCQRFIGK
jgi:hypothetical protein